MGQVVTFVLLCCLYSNTFSSSMTDLREPDVQHAYVNSNGNIELFAVRVISFSCDLNVKQFPLEKQECNVTFGSEPYKLEELHLHPKLAEDFFDEFPDNEWRVVDVTAAENQADTVPSATFTIHLRRGSAFHIVLIVIPSLVLTLLCVLGMFWSKFDCTNYLEKLALGFAAILATCTILQIVETSVPKTSQLPSLTIYIVINLLLETVAISTVVIASKIRSPLELAISSAKIKDRLRRFAFSWCKRLRVFCLVVFPLAAVINLLTLLFMDV
ncbi:unnamed protein product [Cylicocyclus nassatus]|uniref:Neurotransmitter-gated ion-channel ligand-binding domain-containing protein n=1 Tax=Cylicocyclus nassatus TaxID=53992 RepID=A0AA36DNK7_CYLNA|nr:unnamed protein product [Cylicocyclus nassatus]